MVSSCGNDLLKRVYETGFALDDVALYLDTHPMDQTAMNYYKFMKKANEDAICAYEQSYGPLTVDSVTSDNWSWIKNPWPWEGGMRSCGDTRNACNIR